MQQSAPDPNDTITINVGGQLFTTRRSTLFRLPHSRLYMVFYNDVGAGGIYDFPTTRNTSYAVSNRGSKHVYNKANNVNGCVFFDRDPEIFKYILDYYRTGELHLPHSLCGPFIRKELIFWGIPEEDIEPCCLSLYMKYEEERKTKNMLFRDCFEDIEPMKHLVHISRGVKRWRYKSWLFLDFPTSSLAAKIWAVILLVLMAVSIITYSLATHPDFREERRFIGDLQKNNTDVLATIPKQCLAFFNMSEEKKRDDKDYRYDCTIPLPGLIILDIVLNAIFTLEVLVKTIVSPDRSRYLKSPTTILEIFISLSFWLQMLLTHVTTASRNGGSDATIFLSIRTVITISDHQDSEENSIVQLLLAGCNMAQALRVFRIFKLSKISSGLRVLMLTVKKSITELVLLGFLLINGMFLFACLIYLAEYNVKDTFPSIPNALWWAIITITGVGYGDVFPKGGLGYFVGALCAISGCTVTGLAIPIIGHNFNTYYKYMRNYLKEGKYLRELRKERGTFDADQQDQDRLAVIKRKFSRGRRVNTHCCSPTERSAVFARRSSVTKLSVTTEDLPANNFNKLDVGSDKLRKTSAPPFRRSLTTGALLPDGILRHQLTQLGEQESNEEVHAAKLECGDVQWCIEPLRTPKRESKFEPEANVNCANVVQNNSAGLINNNKSLGVRNSDADAESACLNSDKRKSLRKLMGNSFDRSFKRPVT